MRFMNRLVPFCALAFLTLSNATHASTAELVVDLEPPSAERGQVRASDLIRVGSRVLFQLEGHPAGTELWSTQGTSESTHLLMDACPGSCDSSFEYLGKAAGLLYLSVSNEFSETLSLYRTDGTRAGTFRLAALAGRLAVVGPPEVKAAGFAVAGDVAYFAGLAEDGQVDVYRTDGTAEGTTLVPGSSSPTRGGPVSDFHALGDQLVFLSSHDPLRSHQLWISDGTAEGTRSLDGPGPAAGPIIAAATAGSKLFFRTFSGHLWVTDGSAVGSRRLGSTARPDSHRESTQWLIPVGDSVYFGQVGENDRLEIWISDGSLEGTRRVLALPRNLSFGPGGLTREAIATLDGGLGFIASEGGGPPRFWFARRSGGAVSTPRNGCAGSPCPAYALGSVWTLGDRLYFFGGGASGSGDFRLWESNGTPTGTRPVSPACSGDCLSHAARASALGSSLYFSLATDQGPFRRLGDQIWRFKAGDVEASPATAMRGGVLFQSDPPSFSPDLSVAHLRGQLYFSGRGLPQGTALGVADDSDPGSASWVSLFDPVLPGSNPISIIPGGEGIVFRACGVETFNTLWSSDGTASQTRPVAALSSPRTCDADGTLVSTGSRAFFQDDVLFAVDNQGSAVPIQAASQGSIRVLGAAPLGEDLYVIEDDQDRQLPLWRIAAGSTVAQERFLLASLGQPFVGAPRSLDGRLFFVAGASIDDTHLWTTDGTAAGTRRLSNFGGLGPQRTATPGAVLGDAVLFSSRDPLPATFQRIWATQLDTGQTLRLADSERLGCPGVDSSTFARLGAHAFFFAGSSSGCDLMRTDGTPQGTTVIASFVPNRDLATGSGQPHGLTAVGGLLYFRADDGTHGIELWRSDGTAAGTSLVADLARGSDSSNPGELTAADSQLYFAAWNPQHGRELWTTDGSDAGTELVQDLHPGADSSNPRALTVVGGDLYFGASDGLTGRELWRLPLSPATAACVPSGTSLCLGDGRFRVEASWRDFSGRFGLGQARSLTPDTGYFWFFDRDNVEVVLKVLDGRGATGHHWVYYGALSNVEYTLTVTDTLTGAVRRYFNPMDRFASVGDIRAFGPNGANVHRRWLQTQQADSGVSPLPATVRRATTTGPCIASETRLCLGGGRFAVEMRWQDFDGNTGVGRRGDLTDDTGYFWFFDRDNVEVVLKVLDRRSTTGHFWVFYGALSNVGYTLTVTDTETGLQKIYENPLNRFGSLGDTRALPAPPD